MSKFPLFTLRRYGLAVFIVLLAILDPFGLASSSDKASAQWLNRMFASHYANDGQRQVAVVLIDDDYLMRNDTSWPMPYGEQSKLFKRLLAYKPKAVFVDLLYSHDHSLGDPARGSQLLANVFERYQRQGIPLWLANTGLARGEAGQANTLAPFAEVSRPALVAWDGVDDQYPLAVNTPVGLMETPALAMYRVYCATQPCKPPPVDAKTAAQRQPITVQWGLKLAPEQAQIARLPDAAPPRHFLLDAVMQFFQAVFWKLDDSALSPYPYTLTLTPTDLEVTDPAAQALVAELLRDRLVLVGARIASTGDSVESPVHGQLPGVYLHAMALDNLINAGMDYDHEPANFPRMPFNWLDLLELGLLALIAVFKALHARRLANQPAWSRWPQLEAKLFRSPYPSWLMVMVVLIAISAALSLAHITPVNVLGIVLLSLVLFSERIEAFFDRGR
ncbi:CHASE2 domain-containing protein [Pseudomonas tolaasii]|uniref:CHASE2 domain-containing protein n=1 Tax=Pseudomonas tolaasii TaxID=29442 RepID=UPI0015A2F1D9|nr:CHASE2 domain-containing protein [Pseudomonas tolaasii]NVZ43692.1 CHASE2 domain-containing protein [Pseudomonas tolaasii]NWA49406.1 CHASE2 domain-containing protein [Pseudomonas tolaasii]QXQ19127.1 CHASE2 domain-containing protein [Pseudomonas tolaasii]